MIEYSYDEEELKRCALCDTLIENKYVMLVNRYYHKCCLEHAFNVYYSS